MAHAVSPTATMTRPYSPGGGSGEEIYSEINESRIDITITGTMNQSNPSTVGHQFSVRYTVGGDGHRGDRNVYVHKRIKGRPPQLDEDQWEDVPDSPPPYSDNKRTEPSGQRHDNKRSRWGKKKLYIPPGDAGETDTDVQHNPLYGLGLQGSDGNRAETYNY